MFELLVPAIGVPLAKFLAKEWLGDGAGTAVAGGAIDYLKSRLSSERDARRAARQVDEMAEQVVEGLEPFFAREQGKGFELEPVVVELQLTLEGQASAGSVVANRLDPKKLYDQWLNARPEALRALGADQAEAYRTLLRAMAAGLVKVAERLPSFNGSAVRQSLADLEALARQGDEIIKAVRGAVQAVDAVQQDVRQLRDRDDARRQRVSQHEADYRRALRDEASKLRLFGVDYDPATPKEWPLEIAYVPLRLDFGKHAERLDYETLLALLPFLGGRLLIEGVAGSGKTTLNQWTALQALDWQAFGKCAAGSPADLLRSVGPELKAKLGRSVASDVKPVFDVAVGRTSELEQRSTEESWQSAVKASHRFASTVQDWRERTPFLVKLRDCDGSLPGPEGLPALLSKVIGKSPEDWVYTVLKDGRALVLLDGIDEVPDSERADVWKSIEGYFSNYPDTLFIVSSRPDAVDPEKLPLFGAARARVQPMGPTEREHLIEHWHEAVAIELASRGQPVLDLTDTARALSARIRDVPALTQIAETPLLCAAVCFLNRARSGDIPERLVELLRVLSELLISRLDRDRMGATQDRFSLAYRELDTKEKTDALAAIAQHMVREGKPAIADADLVVPLRNAISWLPKTITVKPLEILKALKERSGVLRGRNETTSEFAHNVFRSYLAAIAYAQGKSFSDLLDKARQTADPDLPVLAAAIGGTNYSDRLIGEIRDRLEGAAAADARLLQFMALRCWQAGGASKSLQTDFLLPLFIRRGLQPRNPEEAAWLAELGDRAVPLLRRRKKQTNKQAAACIRALRLIGTETGRESLEAYLDHTADVVVEELAQAVNPLRVAKIRSIVLARNDEWDEFPPLRYLRASDLDVLETPDDVEGLDLRGSGLRSIEALGRFTNLQFVILSYTSVSDLSPLQNLTALRDLSLRGTSVNDLSPLLGLTALQTLSLNGTSVSDLSPLLGLTALQTLSLNGTSVSDLSPLRGLSALQSLYLSGTLVSDLSPLRGLIALQSLYLTSTSVSDLSPLQDLTALQGLHLNSTLVSDLSPLRGLIGLQSLYLNRTLVRDLSPLRDLTSLRTLHMDDTSVSDLSPLRGLTALQILDLDSTPVGNLSPLLDLPNLMLVTLDELEKLRGRRSPAGIGRESSRGNGQSNGMRTL